MEGELNLFTIGFTRKSARDFFEKLREAGVKRVVDVRLNNVSQLAGFSKRDDLEYFLLKVAKIEYVHAPLLAPTQEMLDEYRKEKRGWEVYEKRFLDLMAQRKIERDLDPAVIHEGCLLCSEDQPHHCHRRLVAEYLSRHWKKVRIEHLV